MENMKYTKQLDKKFFDSFARKFDCTISEITKTEEAYVIEMFNGYAGPQPKMWVTDYDLKSTKSYKVFENKLRVEWLQSLKKKFGEKYIADLNDYAENNIFVL